MWGRYMILYTDGQGWKRGEGLQWRYDMRKVKYGERAVHDEENGLLNQ